MSTEWVAKTVEQIKARSDNALATGPFGSAISSRFFQSFGVPVIRGGNLSADIGIRLKDDGLVFVSNEKAAQFRRSLARRGDLIFTCWGTVDQVGLVDDRSAYAEYIVSNKQMKFTPDPERADSLFLYFLFSSPEMQARILGEAIGSSVPGFNLGQLRNIRLLLPPLCEQKAIARTLGALDDKIELNRRMNETLEAMARAIFKSWFVDFDPVRAKAEGRTPSGLSPNLAALFPAALDEDDKPDGWRYCELADLSSELRRGISPAYVESGGVRVINQKCIRNRSVDFGLARRHDTDKRSIVGRELSIGDILINSTGVGTLGRAAQLLDLEEMTIVDSHVTVVRADSTKATQLYVGLMLTGREDEIEALGEGSTGQTELSREQLARLKVISPPLVVQQAFDAVVTPIIGRICAGERESRILSNLRDLLLPKLMSGEVRVKDVEKIAASKS